MEWQESKDRTSTIPLLSVMPHRPSLVYTKDPRTATTRTLGPLTVGANRGYCRAFSCGTLQSNDRLNRRNCASFRAPTTRSAFRHQFSLPARYPLRGQHISTPISLARQLPMPSNKLET